MGWPLSGTLKPVLRGASLADRNEVPSSDPTTSIRRPSLDVNLPDTLKSPGASAGGAVEVAAGNSA